MATTGDHSQPRTILAQESQKLPPFGGASVSSSKEFGCEDWIAKADTFKESLSLDDAQMALRAAAVLTGSAAHWFNTVSKLGNPCASSWKLLKSELKDLFASSSTTDARMATIKTLTQGHFDKSETVRAFHIRCGAAVVDLEQALNELHSGGNPAPEDWVMSYRNHIFQMFFITGLKDEVRRMMPTFLTKKTSKELMTEAYAAETALARTRTVEPPTATPSPAIAAVESTDATLLNADLAFEDRFAAMVNRVSARPPRNGFGGNSGGSSNAFNARRRQPQQQPRKSNGTQSRSSNNRNAPPTGVTCQYCGKFGHVALHCRSLAGKQQQ